jgi:hypothetical protein
LPEKGIISQKVISSRGLFYKVDTWVTIWMKQSKVV